METGRRMKNLGIMPITVKHMYEHNDSILRHNIGYHTTEEYENKQEEPAKWQQQAKLPKG